MQSIEINTAVDSYLPALDQDMRLGWRHVELPAGTEIAVLSSQTIDSSTASAGQYSLPTWRST